MKKLLVIIATLALVLTLCSCKRKNDAKNLEIYSHDGSSYVLRYCGSELDFGDLFITIKDEKLVNFYCEYDSSKYSLKEKCLLVADYSSYLNVTDENGKITFTPNEAIVFTQGNDEDGYEIVNGKELVIYVCFEDINTGSESSTLLADSGITIETSPEALLIFLRNKEIKKNPNATTTTAA